MAFLPSSSYTPDASATVKGKLLLAGDLGGTASSPTVPGLTGKLDLAGGTMVDGANIAVGSTTGTQLATATTQKLAFYGNTPIVQQPAGNDLGTVLANLGLRASGTTYALATSSSVAFSGGFRQGGTNRTGNVTLLTSSTYLNTCDATSAGFTITLPAGATQGQLFKAIKTDATANIVTIAATGINGAATYTLTNQYDYVEVSASSTSSVYYITDSGTITSANQIRTSSGTASSTTYLRGDLTWGTPAGGGGITQGKVNAAALGYANLFNY